MLHRIKNAAARSSILFLLGAFIYMGIEIAYRGFTHWTMGIVGGLCFVVIGGLNEDFDWEMSIIKQALISTGFVTIIEFVSGLILNVLLGLNIWDYSNMYFNIMGQISLVFSLAWFALSIVAIFLDDWLRWLLFKEEIPHYVLFKKGKN